MSRLRRAMPFVGLALFVAALWVLRVELRDLSWHQLTADIAALPLGTLLLAMVLTAINYVALTGYDLLAFASIDKTLSRIRIVVASFLAFAISNNVGFSLLSGTSVRYRFYTRWGVTARELSQIVVMYSSAFWLGLLGLVGISLVLLPMPDVGVLPARGVLVPLGLLLALVPVVYVLVTAVRRRPIRFRQFEWPLPTPGIAIGQVLVSALDWTLAGLVLFVLLPSEAVPVVPFLGTFFVAVLLGAGSQVPGGLGVFEGLMVLLLRPYLGSEDLVPALVVYRAVYYLLPLAVAVVGLTVDAARQYRSQAARVGSALGQLTELLTPRLLALAAFLAGVVLLFSGATPAAAGRLQLIGRFVPIGVIEASHLLTSVAGAVLLVLSHGLARRLDAAYFLTVITMIVGMTTSLLKGFDYEEASLLALVLLVLGRARPAFNRRAEFFDAVFSPSWVAALVGATGASVWLGLFAFKHVDYSNELWWQFALHGEASRFLRATVGAAVVLLVLGLARLIRSAPHDAPAPTGDDLDTAGAAIASQTSTFPCLAYLRDKTLLFSDDRAAFVMYGVQGRTWVALGDPVGPDARCGELIRRFLERCDDFGGVPVFYEVGRHHLHHYADVGLTTVKLGEEAAVDLTRFTLEGSEGAKSRQAMRRLERDGGRFRIIAPASVPDVMGDLRAVSDDWLAAKESAEKGFSLGFFDEAYLARFPVAVIERDGRIEAFANLWPGPRQVELSADLMRYRHDAPKGVMDALFAHVMHWGKAQGYQRFSLGMAPLSGLEDSPVASLWNRLGAFLYEHGESVYDFQGLREYKDKFNPVWEPRYLAYPGGLHLPRILADVSALVAGGYRQIFRK